MSTAQVPQRDASGARPHEAESEKYRLAGVEGIPLPSGKSLCQLGETRGRQQTGSVDGCDL